MILYLKNKPLLAFLLLASTAFSASAAPTYVSCVLPPAKKTPQLQFDFTLDETAGLVSFYWNGQSALVKEPAVFSADKVVWNQPFYLGTTIRRTIDRVTLEYTDETITGRKVTAYKGTCKVMSAAPDRKF